MLVEWAPGAGLHFQCTAESPSHDAAPCPARVRGRTSHLENRSIPTGQQRISPTQWGILRRPGYPWPLRAYLAEGICGVVPQISVAPQLQGWAGVGPQLVGQSVAQSKAAVR